MIGCTNLSVGLQPPPAKLGILDKWPDCNSPGCNAGRLPDSPDSPENQRGLHGLHDLHGLHGET